MKGYVVLLEKKAALSTCCFCSAALPKRPDLCSWLSLGHFDAIHTYSMSEADGSIFELLRKENQEIASLNSEQSYFHPLYLLTDGDDKDFWNENSPFLGVIRIHFAKTTGIVSTFDDLKTRLSKEKSDGIDFRLYRTVELSDAVLVIKAAKLQKLLLFAASMHRWGIIEKIYTYCGISVPCIKDNTWVPASDDKLQWCTMRFSVCSFEKVETELETVRKLTEGAGNTQFLSIVGVDDIAVSWNDLPTECLVKLFREWFFSPKRWHLLSENFSNITTRLGSLLDEGHLKNQYIPLSGNDKHEKNRLERVCSSLLSKKNKILEKANGGKISHSWIKPLSELTITLSRMSKNVLLDEFLYILIPGVSTFMDYVLEKYPAVSDELCESFIENWSNFLEHIMRVERQLTHNPELRPILYDYPIVMLEYTLAFLDQTAKALLSGDGKKETEGKIHIILFPRLGKEKVAYELFEADESFPCGLLLVTIPFDLLFDPRLLLQALCHEASHYIGEKCRNRSERNKFFFKAAARLAAYTLFEHMNKSIIEEIDERMIASMPAEKGTTIKELKNFSVNTVDGFIHSENGRSNFMLNALRRSEKAFPYDVLHWTPTNKDWERFQELIGDLGTLFRETYADMCMLYLLPLEPTEYIKSHETELNAEPDTEKRRYEQAAIRIFISLTACNKTIDCKSIQDSQLSNNIERLQECMYKKEDRDRLFPIAALSFLLDYCKSCFSVMENIISGNDRSEVQEMYKIALDSERYKEFINRIDQYRQNLIDEYDNQAETPSVNSIGVQTIFVSKAKPDTVNDDDLIDITGGLNPFHQQSAEVAAEEEET